MRIAILVALSVLTLGLVSACGGSEESSGTIGGEVTIGTGTNPTSVGESSDGEGEGAMTEEAATTAAEGGEETAAAAGEGDPAAGESVFSGNCAGCHALAAAGANGAVGPNLDELKPTYDQVLQIVTNGKGAMPAFSGQLSEDDIKNVSAYVAENAGK